jgi:hypothetical protein
MLCHLLYEFLLSDFSNFLSDDAYYDLSEFWLDKCSGIR